jgi:hypothetical protein
LKNYLNTGYLDFSLSQKDKEVIIECGFMNDFYPPSVWEDFVDFTEHSLSNIDKFIMKNNLVGRTPKEIFTLYLLEK